MADIINLKTMRKRRDRLEKDEKAATNRAAHGRIKSEKAVTKSQQELASKRLDDHRRDD